MQTTQSTTMAPASGAQHPATAKHQNKLVPPGTQGPEMSCDSNRQKVVDLDTKIKLFIRKYLNPKCEPARNLDDDPWETMVLEASKLDWAVVGKAISMLDYDRLMTTKYWKLVANQVKQRDSRTCQRCGRNETGVSLEAHHLTYDHLGSEHLHLNDLEALCNVCHNVKHGNLIDAVIEEYEAANEGNPCHLPLLLATGNTALYPVTELMMMW